MLLWHVFDGADGQVARLTGRASEWGKDMDGLCDHGTFVALYGALSWSLVPLMGAEAVLLAAAAGISHFVQATAYERQRQLYEFIVLGKPAVRAEVEQIPRVVRWLYRLYLAVQHGLSGEGGLLRLVACRSASMEQLRQLYGQMFRPVVVGWSALSSNYRTLALFAACCAGFPAAFLWWELLGLNAVLLALLLWTHRRQRRWAERIREESAQRL
jgi:phosphatidylglycerophosphate synthase